MELWQQIVDFTDQNAANVSSNQWNLNYLEVVGTSYEVPEKLDDICKRVPLLKIETTTTRYVKPRVKSELNFNYVPPKRTRTPTKPNKSTVVSVKVVMPKIKGDCLTRNCICTCQQVGEQLTHQVNDDDDEITLDKLLHIIQQYDEGVRSSTVTAVHVSNVVTGYQANVALNQDYVKKILMILDSSDHVVQELVLLLIHRLSKTSLNVKLLLQNGVLDDLIYLMLMGSTDELQTQATLCIAKLTKREEFAFLWMETMVISGTEALFDVLAAEEGTEGLRNAVLETIINISSSQKMASILIGFGLGNVIELTRCKTEEGKPFGSPTTQSLATKALTAILSRNSTMVEQFLVRYQDAIENIVGILQYCECPEQTEAARFLATLTLFQSSIDSIISHDATQHLLWAMTCSHCRFVREYTSKAFKNITNHSNQDKVVQALSQFCGMSQASPCDTILTSHASVPLSLTELLSSSSIETNTSKIINAVKGQSSCTPLEKVMVEVFAILSVCFQTDSLCLSGQARIFNSDCKSRGTKNTVNEKYLSSLRVLTNALVAIKTLIHVKDKDESSDEADSLPETNANLNLATLFMQCSGIQFIDQFKFLSAKLQLVNSPCFHSIDPTTLPPREFISSIKNLRTELIFQPTRRKNAAKGYPDFGFHSAELEYIQQTLSLVTLLSQATAPDFDPPLEDLKVFQYRRRVCGKKRHISFRASAVVVKNMLKMAKSTTKVTDVEDKQAVPARKKSSTSRKVSCRSARSTSIIDNVSPTSHMTKSPLPVIELGASSNIEMVHYLKQSLLHSHLISHLAAWITCGVYDIQVNVIKILRYLMHITHAPKQVSDTQSSNGDSQEAWLTRRLVRTSSTIGKQRCSIIDSVPTSKSKSTYLGRLCVRDVIQYCGTYLLDLLKPPACKRLGRMSLMVIREGISNGEADCRIKFVKLDCFAQIIDFVRGIEDEPETQSLGLVVIRSLVSSDQALKQLFYAHGGMRLIMALHEYQQGLVKEEAAFTLTAFSKVSTTASKSRAASISKKRQRKSTANNDIWDHVTQKWQDQDKVMKLLKKFNVKY